MRKEVWSDVFCEAGVLAVTPVTFPLVFVFSAGQAGCTGSHFCLTVAGHQVFDEEQQQLIAGMSPATIQLAWQSTAGETPGRFCLWAVTGWG